MSKESRIEFLPGGVLVGPVEATPPTPSDAAQIFFVQSNNSYGFSPDGVAINYLVHEIVNGTGLNATPTGGSVAVEVDFTEVMRLSTDQSIAGTKTFTGAVVLPTNAGVPGSPGTAARILYDTTNKDLYIDDGTSWAVVGSLQTINANGGLTGGGAGASVDLDVDPGDGIAVSGGKVVINLASDSGLEFSSGGVRVKVDAATTPSTIASVVKRNANGLAIGVDGVTISATAAGGNLQLEDGGVTAAKLAEDAKTAALAKRVFPTRSSISVIFDSDRPVEYVSQFRALQAVTTAKLYTSEVGVYAGHNSSFDMPVKFEDGVRNITSAQGRIGTPIYSRVSSKALLEDTPGIAGITVLGASSSAVNGALLTYNPTTNDLSWNGGANYNPSLLGTTYLKLVGSSSTDYLFVEIDGLSLPPSGLLQVTTINLAYYLPTTQPSSITGVYILGMGASVPASGTLTYTSSGTLLSWNGGAGVNIGASGNFILTGSGGSQDKLHVSVNSLSLPGSNQSDIINRNTLFQILFYYYDEQSDDEVPVTVLEGDSARRVEVSVVHMDTFDSVSINGVLTNGRREIASTVTKFVSDLQTGTTWSIGNPYETRFLIIQAVDSSYNIILESDMVAAPFIDESSIEYNFSSPQTGYILAIG